MSSINNTSVLHNCIIKSDAKSNKSDRKNANYHPSIWKDYFLQYASESMEFDHEAKSQIETLKKEVVKMLIDASKPISKVNLIDLICHLGIQYHFEREFDEVLQQIHNNHTKNGEIITLEDNLRSLALSFRVLRQHGYDISPNVFNKFKDVNENFNEELVTDVEGLLELYEASHLRIHGEDILDEAYEFTSTKLKSIATKLSPSLLAEQVKYSLNQSYHQSLPRLEARRYISIYEQYSNHNRTLLTLAKLDFNYLQNLHRREVGNICK
ncbi:hypothetical protein PIB30_058720 [Stylosanthes scabra]|uniref:Terpene synthase N-terminal domain-containing protein n=1 Tax=Stylosanthes scabra TaxID=79078 RepID=A0ABU6RK11_9FABA|nr:hypothetical protein [Stylosanthes scabra]